MSRETVSVVINIAAGFFVYMGALLAFTKVGPLGSKAAMVLGFSSPAILLQWIAARIVAYRRWRVSTAVVLLSGVGVNLMIVYTMVAVLGSAEYQQSHSVQTREFFGDYLSGFIWTALLALIGVGLLLIERARSSQVRCSDEGSGRG